MRMGLVSLAMSLATLSARRRVALAAPDRIYVALIAWGAVQPFVPLFVLYRQRRSAGFEWRGVRALMARLLRRGMPITLANTVLRLNYRVDVFVVAALLPLSSVGKYSVAVAVGEVLWEVSRSLITGAYPTIAGAPLNGVRARDDARIPPLRAPARTGGLVSTGARVPLHGSVFGGDFEPVWVPLALLVPGIMGSARPRCCASSSSSGSSAAASTSTRRASRW